tara:strand:- start:68176 stop:69747 length:1572 start_codon:yes stop_codon:yes gene_type:complete
MSLSISSILIAFLTLTGLHAAIQRWHQVLSAQLQADFIESMRNELHESIVRAEWVFHLKSRSSDFTHSLVDDINRVARGTMGLLRLASHLIVMIVHFLLALVLSLEMTAVTTVSIMLCWPLLARQNRVAKEAGRDSRDQTRHLFAQIDDQLSGMKELKSLGAESQQIKSFQAVTASINSAYVAFARASATTSTVYTLGAAFLLSILLFVAIEVLSLPFGNFAVIILIFARLTPRFREIHNFYQQVLQMLPAFKSVSELRTQCQAAHQQVENKVTAAPGLTSRIDLKNVSFRYDQAQDIWAIRNINLTIPARMTTAIVGTSGSGKSTLADLLIGLITPESGTILVDNEPLSSENAAQWRQRVGYVPQETVLFHDTVRANLLWAKPDGSDDDLLATLELAAALPFVRSLPAGLDTLLGDRGTRLSGGERQRIALARALLRQPSVLILDEATSSLDSENQKRIQEAIFKLNGKLTIIVIAHRLSTVRNADQIILIEHGAVSESGTWDELAAFSDGRFRSLINADFG